MGYPSANEISRKLNLTAAQLGALDNLSTVELAALDGITAGTATASKALVLGASKEIATITSATITTLTAPTVNATDIDAGASGVVGSVDVFPATASRGKTSITAANNTGNTTTNINTAAQAAARTYTVPDAGASGSFLLSGGNAAVSLTGTGATSTGTMTTLTAQVTTAALTTAAAGNHVATITYTGVAATDIAFATIVGGTNTTKNLTIQCACTANTITVTIFNNTAATAVNGTIIFNLLVVKV